MDTKTPEVTLDSTANEVVALYSHMQPYFEDLGIDDCCMELDLRTTASQLGKDETGFYNEVQEACSKK